ncbi:SigE family RNA polymerase sigma factor [Dactylosporangium siamense]|uniref:DNA-directed RNA polymerase sigma-70 factor n=1 Tax=Dactylosporangium siamense TaxID=685454 RepID=A0A919PR38_9ACTN|nr:SigE family RNA polymerase sigma factor [Dactylosporangium siamense]GIG49335.1 DNA-directed RNA polymerase sigma-70 factor [Dactylosporangium siamense]
MRDFDEFAAAAAKPLLRLGWLLTGDANQAQDLAQSTLIRTYGAWHRVRHDDALSYARRIMVNLHTDWLRRRPWREQPRADLHDGNHRGNHRGDLSGGHDGGHGAVEDRAALVAALQSLTRRERAAIVLRYYVDLSEQQTAQTLGVSVGTVKSVCSRALAKLRVSPALREERPFVRTAQGELS